jgi:DNA polymerase-3 subunit delta
MIETKLDKRTATYKELKKQAKIIELMRWADHDNAKAEKWVLDEAERLNISLDTKCAQVLVRRVGLDQWQLFHALEKLFLVEKVTVEVIETLIDANSVENVFNLFDVALRADGDKVVEMIRVLELSEDPYRLFALLSSQAFQLAAVVMSSSSDEIAKDFGIHPYSVSKLVSSAKRLNRGGIKKIINAFAEADDDMKLSKAEPWLLIERALMKVVRTCS